MRKGRESIVNVQRSLSEYTSKVMREDEKDLEKG
jgi:hypothetical protein